MVTRANPWPIARALAQSLEHNDAFWGAKAVELLQWDAPFTKVQGGTFGAGDIHWWVPSTVLMDAFCTLRLCPARSMPRAH
jgi:hypothetical protein